MRSRKRQQGLSRRSFLILGGLCAAGWLSQGWLSRAGLTPDRLRQAPAWLVERPTERLLVYIDNTDSGSTTLRGDRSQSAWAAVEHFLREAPVGSQAEFFCTGQFPGNPEPLGDPFSPLVRKSGRFSATAKEGLRASLEQRLGRHDAGRYSSIIEDTYTLLQRNYNGVPVDVVVISDLQQFTGRHSRKDRRVSAHEQLTLQDLLKNWDQVLERFPPPQQPPRGIRVYYVPPKKRGSTPEEVVKAAWRRLFTAWVGGDPKHGYSDRVQGLGNDGK